MEIFRKNRLLLLSILSGILFALSWPASGIPLIIFVAFVPLLIVEEHIYSNRDKYSRYAVLGYAWAAFLVFNGLTTWWIVFATIPGVFMALIFNSLFMAVAFYLMHLSRRVLPGKRGVLSLLVFWLSFEYLHLDWELSWSWLNLGNVFASQPGWVQWYEYTGVLGGTAWIIILNICFFKMYRAFSTPLQTIVVTANIDSTEGSGKQRYETYLKNQEQFLLVKSRMFSALATIFFLVVPSVISLTIRNDFTMPDDPVEVVIVQPGRDPYRHPADAHQLRVWTDSIIMLADQKISPHTRFVIAPEASFPGALWLNNPAAHYGYSELKAHSEQFDSIAWIAGLMMYRQYGQDDLIPATARTMKNSDRRFDVYNAALYLDSEGKTDSYFKSKLVPGVEKMPFAKLLKPFGVIVEFFGGTSGSMGVQETRAVFEGPDGTKVAPVICYESIYGSYLNEYIRNGAQLIFIITNDGWWRDTPGYRQHNQYARLRAVETRRSIARAAKTGISGFIDPLGRPTLKTNWWEATAIKSSIHKNDELTFYVINGDYLGKLAFFLMLLLAAYMITQSVIKRNRIHKG
jgi:apolipoprotein N-acyltransferase